MYKNLVLEMAKNNIGVEFLAEKLNISEGVLSSKIEGSLEFYWSEASEIRNIVAPERTLDYLFEYDLGVPK